MGKRKFCYLQREAMKTVSAIALVTYAICASMPVSTTVSQVMLARILSGGTPIEEGNDAFPIDWLLLLASTAGQAPTGLAIVAALMRIQVAKWAKGPYVGGEPTDFFTGWNDALFEARFCYKKKDMKRLRLSLEIPDIVYLERPRGRDRPGKMRRDGYDGDWALCVYMARARSAGTLLDVALQCNIDFRVVSALHLLIQNHIYDYKISPTYPIDNNLPPGGRALLSDLRMWAGWCEELKRTGTLNGIPQRVNSWRTSLNHSA
jgi:hypothetical protein